MTVPLIDTSKPPVVAQPAGGPFGKLNRIDFKKLGTGLLVAIIGAVLTYGTEALGSVDLGETWTPVAVVMWSLVVNVVRKLLDAPKSTT